MEYAVSCVVEIELRDPLAPSPGDAHRHIERHVSETVQELSHRWISGCEVDLDRSSSQATFLVVVDAGEQQRAVSKAWGVLSMAVHAAGGATSHRPFPRDAEWSVRLLNAYASRRARDDRTAAFA